uniref:DoxX family protein n=1 Tax=unclassified Variovorax TaxID=663243 RepID=UPI000D38F7FE
MAPTLIYWTSTALLSLLYVASAAMYIAKGHFVRQAQADLGYSAPLLVPFMIAIKLLGPLAILWHFNVALSDLAYAGIFYHLLLSGLAHLGVRKPKGAIPAAVGFVLLVSSFATQNAARDLHSPHAPAATAVQALFN